MKLSIIIPAYNEEKNIGFIINQLLNLKVHPWKKEIIVVDDSSTDTTRLILKKYQSKVKLVFHSANSGKGTAIRSGIKKAIGDYIIIQDADREYNPQDIRSLLVTAENNPGFAIFGSRFRGRHVDTIFGHKTGNLLLTTLTNLLYGSEISDMETCYKLIPRPALSNLQLFAKRFDFEPEITAKLLKSKVGILEVPISYQKRGFSEGKKIKWFQDGLSAVWTLFKHRLI